MNTKVMLNILLVVGLGFINSCAKEPEEVLVAANTRFLYVASGVCYSGGNTTFTNATSSNLIYRLGLNSGAIDATIADYFSSPSNPGDSPAGMVDGDGNYLYVLIENTTTASLRRIEKVEKKSNGSRSIFSNNAAALNAQVRNLFKLPNGDFAVSKSTAIEYFTASNVRLGTPYISATSGACATSTTLISKVLTLPNGKFIFLHAGAGQNRIGIFAATGGTTCLAAQAAPTANAFPTAAIYDAVNAKLIVAYAGNAAGATDVNSIYVYSIDEATNAITSPEKIYDASLYPGSYSYLLYGISEMAYDPTTGSIFIATTTSTASTVANYAIEKFRYNPSQIGVDNTQVLVRSGSAPFLQYGNDTKCISKMFIGN
jgi:hypothetical protein